MASSQAARILQVLRETYPEARTELLHDTPFQLLVATVLSAQCTDRAVNQVTPALFSRFPDACAMAQATPQDIEPYVRSLGLFRSKARHLSQLAQRLCQRHGGKVPRSREELEALPGVGRKTASVVLANAFGVPALPVDTHVQRVARRLGLTQASQPRGVEEDLCRQIPEPDWIWAHHALIWHGRRVCTARRPRCHACPLVALCPTGMEQVHMGVGWEGGEEAAHNQAQQAAGRQGRRPSSRRESPVPPGARLR